jgi:hypothetical protein
MNSHIVANSRRSYAVQRLRTWICVTDFFGVVVGFRILRFDLKFDSGPAFRCASLPLTWWPGLFRISSSSVLLSPISLCSRLPDAGAASQSRSAPVSRCLLFRDRRYARRSPLGRQPTDPRHRPATNKMMQQLSDVAFRVQAGAHGQSLVHRLQLLCNGLDGVC